MFYFYFTQFQVHPQQPPQLKSLIFCLSCCRWLIEVNASPSLTASSQEDYELKCRLLEDTLHVVDMEGWYDVPKYVNVKYQNRWCSCKHVVGLPRFYIGSLSSLQCLQNVKSTSFMNFLTKMCTILHLEVCFYSQSHWQRKAGWWI